MTSATSKYADDHEREMAKWAHHRVLQAREEREISLRASLDDMYEGYYPEDDG